MFNLKTVFLTAVIVLSGYVSHSFALDQEHNFESGQFTMSCSGNCPTVTTKYAREGKYSMESYVNRNTSPFSFRTEATLKPKITLQRNRDYWFGFSVLLPVGWEVPNVFELIAQFHASEPTGSPPFAILTGSGKWKINSRYDGGMKDWFLNDVSEDVGKWTDWVIHYKPSLDAQGIVEVWKNGKLVASRTGPNDFSSASVGPYFKMGMYLGWKDRTCCNSYKPEKVVYHDALRVASGPLAKYEDVAPRNTTPVCTSPAPATQFRTQSCPTGTIGTYQQTNAFVSAPYPTCWTAGTWLPSTPPAGACVTPSCSVTSSGLLSITPTTAKCSAVINGVQTTVDCNTLKVGN
jgi:hypothetical protein